MSTKQCPKCSVKMKTTDKLMWLLLFFFIPVCSFGQSITDSISITDYQSNCVEIKAEENTIKYDSLNLIYSNGEYDLAVSKSGEDYLFWKSLFVRRKISIQSIIQIITEGKTFDGPKLIYAFGSKDISNLIIDNQSGKCRVVELTFQLYSGHPEIIHLALYNENGKATTNLLDFIVNSTVICLKYNHTQI